MPRGHAGESKREEMLRIAGMFRLDLTLEITGSHGT